VNSQHGYRATEHVRRCSILIASKDYHDAREQEVTPMPELVPVPEHLMETEDSRRRSRLAQRQERARGLEKMFKPDDRLYDRMLMDMLKDDPDLRDELRGHAFARAAVLLRRARMVICNGE
jgi:hypothetical protein